MIRFLDLSNQLESDVFTFAWFNTINDRFLTFNGNQIWEKWEEFLNDLEEDCNLKNSTIDKYGIQRFKSLFPENKLNEGVVNE